MHLTLRVRLGLVLPIVALLLSLLATLLVARLGGQLLESSVGNSTGLVAGMTSDEVERMLFEQYRELTLVGGLLGDGSQGPNAQRELLQLVQSRDTDYAWIGIAATDGRVLVGTGG